MRQESTNPEPRPHTFEEWIKSLRKIGPDPMDLAYEAWHARDAAFAQVEKERDQLKAEVERLKHAEIE